jgi:hypothetical protein
MFSKIKQIWEESGFEIVLGLCVAFILIYALWKKITGGKGTWSKKQYYSLPRPQNNKPSRQPPRESKGEVECRRVLQYLFKRPFHKARPDFLRNPVTGGNFNLELDCFDPELKIAVEYNGVQHYKYVPYFHKNKEAFLNQKYRDTLKGKMCKEHGVTLITVPNTIKLEDIKGFIEKELRRNGYKV